MGDQENYEEADAGGRGGINRNIIIMSFVGIIAVVIIVATINVFGGGGVNKNSRRVYSFDTVFERLTPEEAAKLREELSYSGFHFKTIVDGKFRVIQIREDEIEDARLEMAKRGLPAGGAVGFEIFDKSSNLGVTDFDKRIKYIRAISGELSRNISRIRSISNARVQIVMPEEKAFSFKKTPVTSSVLIQRKPGFDITAEQVRGIMHLVASSVEGLKPENVTVVDMDGNILSERVSGVSENVTLVKEETFISANAVEEIFDFKGNLEKELSQKAQEVLNKIFPLGSTYVITNVEISVDNEGVLPVPTKIDVLIMLDDKNYKVILSDSKKKSAYSSVATAVGYVKGRDHIKIKRAEFAKQVVTESQDSDVAVKEDETSVKVEKNVVVSEDNKEKSDKKNSKNDTKQEEIKVITKEIIKPVSTVIKDKYDKESGLRRSSFGRDVDKKDKQIELVKKQSKFFNLKIFLIVIVIVIILIIVSYFYKKSKAEEEIFSTSSEGDSLFGHEEDEDHETEEERAIKDMADTDSSKIADVLKDWLSEDEKSKESEESDEEV